MPVATAVMKAVRLHDYGGPEVLRYEDVPVPSIKDDEVLVRVYAAAVNPVDWKVRKGLAKNWLHHQLPLIPGWDVAGIIEKKGANAMGLQAGDQVFGLLDLRQSGAYAQFVAAKASYFAKKPATLDFINAAAVPLATLTAWQALFDTAGLIKGQTVLIHAAAGGVGHMAVQLAKWKGAKVIGTASAGNLEFLHGLGADEAIDYNARRFDEIVKDADVVLDTLGGDVQERSWKVLKKDGILVSIVGAPSKEQAAQHDVRATSILVHPDSEQLTRLASMIDDGRIKPHLDAVMPLSEAGRAHELSQAGHVRGKIVLVVP
ncbi:MAG: NADP-dependent oxidoreductase [Actinomycetota bacterium]|nr:NADP-dependent oxidoreductase [Actinomycetota bacterium]